MDKLNEILPYIYSGNCVLFIGAGFSHIAGCKDWNTFTQELLNHPVIQEQNKIKFEELRLENSLIIDYCLEILEKNELSSDYLGLLRKTYMFNHELYQREYVPIIKELTRSIKPIPKIITTNIDDCLERSGEFELNKIFYNQGDLSIENFDKHKFVIFHLHGFVENIKDIVFPYRKYIEQYSIKNYSDLFEHIFLTKTVLFLGYGLKDTKIRDLMYKAYQYQKNHFISNHNVTRKQICCIFGK